MDDTEALCALHARGAHLSLRNPRKAPLYAGWKENPAGIDDVLKHHARGGLIGLIPESIGLVVVDVDQGEPDAVVELVGEPIARHPSGTPGREHLWYAGEGVRGGPWEHGDCKGDILAGQSAAILWDPSTVAGAHVNGNAPLDVSRLRSKRARPQATGPEAVRDAPKGQANHTLFREAKQALKTLREAAIERGHTPREADSTLDSAIKSTLGDLAPYEPSRLAPRDEVDAILTTLRHRAQGGIKVLTPGLAEVLVKVTPGEYILLAAKAGGMKTSMTVAECAAQLRAGSAVLYFALDQDRAEVYRRMVGAHFRRPWATFDPTDARCADDFYLFMDRCEGRFSTLGGRWTGRDLKLEILNWRESLATDRCLVVIDTVAHVSAEGTNAYERHSRIAEVMHHVARSTEVVLLTLTHLNREVGKQPTLDNVSNTSVATQLADRVVALWPAKPTDKYSPEQKVLGLKNRYPCETTRWTWQVRVSPDIPMVQSCG